MVQQRLDVLDDLHIRSQSQKTIRGLSDPRPPEQIAKTLALAAQLRSMDPSAKVVPICLQVVLDDN